jgi:tRNA threonylcarbamoyladenosine biosynthesis protein TsaB
MRILALEFSSTRRSVAIRIGSQLVGHAAQHGDHGGTLFALLHRALDQAALRREQIECLAVGLGPGSYAGIRSSIAVAQGWQLARHVHLLGIPSVESLALQAHGAGLRGRVHFLIDAQRSEYYLAAYEIGTDAVRPLRPLCLVGAAEASRAAAEGPLVVSPELAARFPGAAALEPDAAALSALAELRSDFVTGPSLQPIYLRETSFVKAPAPRAH